VSRADADQMVLQARLIAGWITEADLAGPEEEEEMTEEAEEGQAV
jgi:N utilization substance protein A